MIEFNPTITVNITEPLEAMLSDANLANLMEAIVRNEIAELRRVELDAPGPPPPSPSPHTRRLRRDTGFLSDTTRHRSEKNGLRQVIEVTAPYARHAHDRKPFTEHYIERRADAVRQLVEDGVRRLVS